MEELIKNDTNTDLTQTNRISQWPNFRQILYSSNEPTKRFSHAKNFKHFDCNFVKKITTKKSKSFIWCDSFIIWFIIVYWRSARKLNCLSVNIELLATQHSTWKVYFAGKKYPEIMSYADLQQILMFKYDNLDWTI